METQYIIAIVTVVFLIGAILIYNNLVVLKARILEALSGVDIQLKRRSDLVPNLVATVKGYATHEKTVFEKVTEARSALLKAEGMHDKAVANDMLTGALKSLFAVAEAYPDLKANSNFQELQRQLEDTEDKVAYSRQFYNSQVLEFNSRIAMFPINLFSTSLRLTSFEFFKADEKDQESIKVQF